MIVAIYLPMLHLYNLFAEDTLLLSLYVSFFRRIHLQIRIFCIHLNRALMLGGFHPMSMFAGF